MGDSAIDMPVVDVRPLPGAVSVLVVVIGRRDGRRLHTYVSFAMFLRPFGTATRVTGHVPPPFLVPFPVDLRLNPMRVRDCSFDNIRQARRVSEALLIQQSGDLENLLERLVVCCLPIKGADHFCA